MRRILFLLPLLFVVSALRAQGVVSNPVRRFRIEGMLDAQVPVALRSSSPVTVTFDVTDTERPDFHVRLWHCDKDWKRTESLFLNDAVRNVFRGVLASARAPIGVRGYAFTYSLRLPGLPGFESFAHSGNYIVEIWNTDETALFASGRFFVAESIVRSGMKVENRRLPSESSPTNEVHRIAVAFAVPPPAPGDDAPLVPTMVRTMDVYRNREFYHRMRVDPDDDDPETRIEGFGTSALTFVYDHAPAGSTYRTVDLRDPGPYPAGSVVRRFDGADVSRMQVPPSSDHLGNPVLVADCPDADYVTYRAEVLRPPGTPAEDIRIAGEFNQWDPGDEWRLRKSESENRYTAEIPLRRGVHDYQYVLNGTDWTALEGNDWRAVCVYTAVIYYHDPRLGGYDRIIAVSQRRSPGGNEATVY